MATARDEKELLKFTTNPAYREKTILKIHRERDAQYNLNIKRVESEINKLTKDRTNEITRIANARWENVVNGKFAINRTEGKAKINQNDVLFSSIKGAELNAQQGFRVVTTDNSKSKKHASVGGALVGGALFGPIGAMAGGVGLGKTKTKGQSVSNQIPTCMHLGVLVNVDGFVSEITLLENQVDQSSPAFTKAYNLAQQIVTQLGTLSKTPVPSSFIQPEEETSVKNIEAQIASKQEELQVVIADKPTYELPDMYRSEEQKDMTDEEYLEYLRKNDAIREEEMAQNKELAKQQKAQLKELKRKEKEERRANKKHPSGTVNTNGGKVASVIADVVFWILSVFSLLMSIGAFASNGVVSGILIIVTAILINPVIYKIIRDKIYPIKRWICIIIFFVGFMAGILTMPTTANNTSTSANAETGIQNAEDTVTEDFYGDTVVEGELPTIDSLIAEKLTEVGYSIEHATEIQNILNNVGITEIEIYHKTGEAEKGLNAMSCYANGSKEDKSRFTLTTEDGVAFYVGFLDEDLYDVDKGGFLKQYTDVHIPETKIDMDTYSTLQELSVKEVKGCLNYPNTADFKTLSWGVGRSDDNYKIIGVVSAENGLGVESDINFSVWFKNSDNNFIVEGVALNGTRIK